MAEPGRPGGAGPPVWRYVADDGVTASFGLAADEVVTRRQGTGASPPTLRLYTYASHCALVGRFQRLASELHLDACRRLGVAVNRRPTGGGAIVMGADQLGVAIMGPPDGPRSYDRTRELFQRFSAGLVAALGELGIAAEYRRKNDVEVGRRKIAGLGIWHEPGGGLLFHASLLVDLDVAFMLRVLRTPFPKISDKAIATVADRMTTVRRELGRAVTTAEVRRRLADAYARALGIALEPGAFTPEERAEIARLEAERYARPAWLAQEPATPDAAGVASLKTPGGVVTAQLTLAGDMVKAVYFTGDFFADETVLAGIERALRWHPAAHEAVEKTLLALDERDGLRVPGVSAPDLGRLVGLAAAAARRHEGEGLSTGCFVDP